MVKITDFMLNLQNKFVEDGKTESTAHQYINTLYVLNNKEPFKNITFLKRMSDVMSKLEPYSENTKKSYLAAIVSTLKFYEDKPTYKKVLAKYQDLLNDKIVELKNKPKNVKSKKQEDNWVSWEEIQKIKDELISEVDEFKTQKNITSKQYLTLLKYFVLSLYTEVPPRRNQDYQMCYIIKKFSDKLSTDRNYYSIDDKCFYFNVYKTSKTYGQQKICIGDNEPLKKAFEIYLKFHPSCKGRFGKNKQVPLLVTHDGSPMSSVNAITRLLHKIFGKNVGSSMLRHIYLTAKYGDELTEMKSDANAMGHSMELQKEYIVNKSENEKIEPPSPKE